MLLSFEKPLITQFGSLLIGSKFDSDITANVCRLAFYGPIINTIDVHNQDNMLKLKVYREKQKKGIVEKVLDD